MRIVVEYGFQPECYPARAAAYAAGNVYEQGMLSIYGYSCCVKLRLQPNGRNAVSHEKIY